MRLPRRRWRRAAPRLPASRKRSPSPRALWRRKTCSPPNGARDRMSEGVGKHRTGDDFAFSSRPARSSGGPERSNPACTRGVGNGDHQPGDDERHHDLDEREPALVSPSPDESMDSHGAAVADRHPHDQVIDIRGPGLQLDASLKAVGVDGARPASCPRCPRAPRP